MIVNKVVHTPPNKITDYSLVDALVASMQTNGWMGVPVVVHGDMAVTGSHRMIAAEIAGIDYPTIELSEIFEANGYDLEREWYDLGPSGQWWDELAATLGCLPSCILHHYGMDV